MYQVQDNVLRQIEQSLLAPENGGILGIDITDRNVITHFYYDSSGITEGNTYTPDVNTLNDVIREWSQHGIEFIGFVHSHPKGSSSLSNTDIEYANRIKTVCDMPHVLMAIYLPDNRELHKYIV